MMGTDIYLIVKTAAVLPRLPVEVRDYIDL